ncbi:MAG: glyceraldehyde-3-phosphate dehydrogenase [Gammaproteobacteria bacterium]|nr:glyceraldehyde-3-phosphate dehydrogenase [Gammaproteobacteria bacterium]
MTKPGLESVFADWKEREALAEGMIPLIGNLYRRNVVIYIHGKPLVNESVIEIMKIHRFVRQIEQNELSEFETYPMLETIAKLDLGPVHLDLGKLTSRYMADDEGLSVAEYARKTCAPVIGNYAPPIPKPRDVVIYGFGRVGRLVARLLIEKTGAGHQLVLKGVVLRPPENPERDLSQRGSLLRRDSIHGPFNGTIRVDEESNSLICNGNVIRIIYANSPEEIDYTDYGIDDAMIIDSTGMFKDRAGLSRHLKARGASKVLLTASAKDDVKNVVSGINSNEITPDDNIIAAASCTTNAIVPVLKCMHEKFGIVNGHMETVHAYTNDQNLVDNDHPKDRRGRSAALNMVLTSSGATKSVGLLLPELKGKLTGSAIRVPVANVSMAILNLTVERETSRDEVNDFLRDVSLNSVLQRQIDYTVSSEVVSSDFIGNRHAGIIDSYATIVAGKSVILYVWYDNEFGYSCQLVRVAQKMAGIHYPVIPVQPVSGSAITTVEERKIQAV